MTYTTELHVQLSRNILDLLEHCYNNYCVHISLVRLHHMFCMLLKVVYLARDIETCICHYS